MHGARKTCGSLLAALDVHPRVAMQILRHSKIAITMEIYTEVPRLPPATRSGSSRAARPMNGAVAAPPIKLSILRFVGNLILSALSPRGYSLENRTGINSEESCDNRPCAKTKYSSTFTCGIMVKVIFCCKGNDNHSCHAEDKSQQLQRYCYVIHTHFMPSLPLSISTLGICLVLRVIEQLLKCPRPELLPFSGLLDRVPDWPIAMKTSRHYSRYSSQFLKNPYWRWANCSI